MKTHTKIDTFPKFSPLSFAHKEHINRFTGKFDPYSDFNFVSLFSWNVDGSAEVAMLNGNLVIRYPDYLAGDVIYSILGDKAIDESLDELLSKGHKLKLIPEVVVRSIVDKERYIIEEDRDNFDYVYNLDELSRLENGKYKKLRNKKNAFAKYHEGKKLEVRTTHYLTPESLADLKEVARQWSADNNKAKGDIVADYKALMILLDNFRELNLLLVELLVDGELKAFSVNEAIENKFAICHFEKALLSYHPHTYNYLISCVAEKLQVFGCTFVNWEQDLGLEGLRHSKLAYHPSSMLKKYTISAKQ